MPNERVLVVHLKYYVGHLLKKLHSQFVAVRAWKHHLSMIPLMPLLQPRLVVLYENEMDDIQ